MKNALIAGVEIGGTKTIALIADGTNIIESYRVPSENPALALGETSKWLMGQYEKYKFAGLGIASFGPICLDRSAPNYGYISQTPKPNWANTNVIGAYSSWFNGAIGFDTDVNGAALAEYIWGASKYSDVSIYLTIGTGIGGGLIINGTPIHGFMHPEMGHMRIKRHFDLDFKGVCPFHRDCIEGLASGPAIKARSGRAAEHIPPNDEIWEIVSDEIAQFLANLILALSPQKILIGGGVFVQNDWLFEKLHKKVANHLGGYVAGLDVAALKDIITAPFLGANAGPLGAIALGKAAIT